MNEDYEEVRLATLALMAREGWTQRDLANVLGVNQCSAGTFCAGTSVLSRDPMQTLLTLLRRRRLIRAGSLGLAVPRSKLREIAEKRAAHNPQHRPPAAAKMLLKALEAPEAE